MVSFTDVAALIPTVGARLGERATAIETQAAMEALTDAEVVAVLEESASVIRHAEQVRVIAAGIVAARSSRDAGHAGLSQSRGHSSAVSLVQQVTGSSKAEAARQVRVGQALLTVPEQPDAGEDAQPAPADWRMPLREALRENRLSSAQFDVIQRGLGGPDADPDSAVAWTRAAEQLAAEAADRTLEELAAAARTIRDLIDPESVEARYLARYERRAFRTWTDEYGARRASIAFDDEGGLFFDSVVAAALRPRRGGPRFVDPEEKARAAELADDLRTNDQLAYDLVMDVFRAGVLADAESVFGTRQAGVRLVRVVDEAGVASPVAHTEDHLVALPGAIAARRVCDAGVTPVTVDGCGNPLDVGREQRLFTPKQRIALAVPIPSHGTAPRGLADHP